MKVAGICFLIMSTKKLLTLKVEQVAIDHYTDVAASLKMNRSEMVRTAIAEFIQKQNPQAA